jgi:tyrosyl-tRNA synthetase
VEIGDPSGRTTARNPQERVIKEMNRQSMHKQLSRLWTHVKALGIKHGHPAEVGRDRYLLSNWAWHKDVSALELVGTLGAGMRLGAMLNRDS